MLCLAPSWHLWNVSLWGSRIPYLLLEGSFWNYSSLNPPSRLREFTELFRLEKTFKIIKSHLMFTKMASDVVFHVSLQQPRRWYHCRSPQLQGIGSLGRVVGVVPLQVTTAAGNWVFGEGGGAEAVPGAEHS